MRGERVVVRADHDPRPPPRQRADDVAQPGLARDRLEVPARQQGAQLVRELLSDSLVTRYDVSIGLALEQLAKVGDEPLEFEFGDGN